MTVQNDTDSIFTGSADKAPVDHAGNDNDVNYLDTLVGDGKKYASAEQLAKAYAHLDRFTERIKDENSGLRAELGSKVSLEELVTKLSNQNTITNSASNQNANNDNGERLGSDSGRGLSQAEVAELVRKSITEEQTKANQAYNRKQCVDELKKTWGSDYLDKLKDVQRTLGVSTETLDGLAATSPGLFLNAVLGSTRNTVTQQVDPNAAIAPRSSINPAASAMRQAGPKEDWAYFEKMRVENPSKYWSPNTQNRMFELTAKGLLVMPS